METDRKSYEEQREHFGKFIALLTGELGIEAVFGSSAGSSGSKQIILPDLDGLDSKSIDFLYSLCLREAGLLSMSKRSVASISSHASEGELGLSFAIEMGRVERALMRKFAGAQEILDHHWKVEAADPRFTASTFGFLPSEAKPWQAFAFACKWALIGKPAYGWRSLFGGASWDAAVAVVEASPVKELISGSRLRKWEDSCDLSAAIWKAWVERVGVDKSPKLTPTPKAKKVAEALRELEEGIPQKLSGIIDRQHKAEDEMKNALARARQILGASQPRIDELNRQIHSLGKQMAPFKAVAGLLDQAGALMGKHAHESMKASSAQSAIQALQEKQNLKKATAASAAESAKESTDAKARDLEQTLEELKSALASHATAPTPEQQSRMDALAQKIEEAKAAAQAKEAGLASKISELEMKKGASPEKDSKLSERQASLKKDMEMAAAHAEKKLSDYERKLADLKEAVERSLQNSQQKLSDKIEELERKLESVLEAGTQKQANAMGRAELGSRDQERLARQQAAASSSMAMSEEFARQAESLKGQAESEARKNVSTAGLSADELQKQIGDFSEQLSKASSEKHSMEQPAAAERQKASELRSQMKAAAKEASVAAHECLQNLQSKMDAAGIPCELCERMEEIPGWEAANDIQREFDRQASKALGEPVVNGSGGGAGGRNALEEIALKAQGISEINPNEIFSGVQKLSPLSGFGSASNGGSGRVESAENSGAGMSSSRKHLVWRKDRDKIVSSVPKDSAAVARLMRKHAKAVEACKKLFKEKLRPSTKPKFKGGREEGLLDGRSIWKLAAGQGDDFYEIDVRKADRKAAACILIDQSGSLGALGADAAETLQSVALAISEGLSACNVEHEILGHCAPHDASLAEQKIPDSFNRKSCRLETKVFKSFSEKGCAGLGTLAIEQADNSDGEAVRIAAGRLQKKGTARKILFLIGDGKPFMQDADSAILDEDLRKALLECSSKKMEVISIGFGRNGHPVIGASHFGIDSLDSLADQLGKLLGK